MARIGVLTSGGDAPGMNAAVRSVVRAAIAAGAEVMGIERGYHGLVHGQLRPMVAHSVSGIINQGGTILRTARSEEFKTPEGQQRAAQTIAQYGLDGIAIVGGDGSYRGAIALNKTCGVNVIGLPGTIDNDIPGTDYTIGFDTAINTALDAIDKIRDTATSHDRVFVVEVMGRHSGSIAVEVGLAGGAEAVLIPECKPDILRLCHRIEEWQRIGKMSCIVVVAEGAASGADISATITQVTGIETRLSVIGHMQRGGRPSSRDRTLATLMGHRAAQLLVEGKSGLMVGVVKNEIGEAPLEMILSGGRPLDISRLDIVETMAT